MLKEKNLTKIKLVLSLLGGALSLFGVFFMVTRLVSYIEQIDLQRFHLLDFMLIALFMIIYALMNLALTLAWRNIIDFLGISLIFPQAVYLYGVSQLAKYVPGNVFHIAGRQALGMAAGVPGWALVKSSIWELGLLSFAGALFGILALPLWLEKMPFFIGVLLFGFVLFIVGAGLSRMISRFIGRAFCWQVLFLFMSGVVFVGILAILSPGDLNSQIVLEGIGAFVVAWLIGLLTPGAPAGLGVRELVLMFLLKGLIGEADLVLAVIVGRVITVAGDFLFCLGALVLGKKLNPRVES